MAILPAQTIRALCDGDAAEIPLIYPFAERGFSHGLTYGLGPCTYDMRIAQDLILLPLWMLPLYALLKIARVATRLPFLAHVRCFFALGSTIETVAFPADVCGTVMDKSSNARRGLSVFNTKFDPGFVGYPTLELHNCSLRPLVFRRGMPICQFKFERLEAATVMPYVGRYQGQGKEPTPYRAAKGTWE
jgi:dCTP deaminase